eukprot:TRINITY_DN879_c0_g1_i3.p1 TRINITY_DN879_c0_g1~~TRINITY_DN879_c0_g1_i3.p1  ORF type:complete len:323 (+),score=-19.91 TRINITY_DN879_c0_g1_i3:469-1437(+)
MDSRTKAHLGSLILVTLLSICGCFGTANARTFLIRNNCGYRVWPGVLSNAGIAPLSSTGFVLESGGAQSVNVPEHWSGRVWGRTGCVFDSDGKGNCTTADCGGQLECNGAGAMPPATLAELTLSGSNGQDFYDVSLVDGYNLPMLLAANGGSGACNPTGCITDLNRSCPKELQIDDSEGQSAACKSACEAFGSAQYCCSGAYSNPNTCKPTSYSQLFKSACPRAYSYAYDDSTSTFTCTGADYAITFCPSVAMATNAKPSTSPSPNDGSAGNTSSTSSSPLYVTRASEQDSSYSLAPQSISYSYSIVLVSAMFLSWLFVLCS